MEQQSGNIQGKSGKNISRSSGMKNGSGSQTKWATLLRGGPIIALLFLFVYFSFASPHFASFGNFKNIAQQNAFLIILAVGQTMVITGAGNALVATIKDAALVEGPLRWGSTDLRAGEIGFIGHRAESAGAFTNLFTLATS